jgi:hypothetical protein
MQNIRSIGDHLDSAAGLQRTLSKLVIRSLDSIRSLVNRKKLIIVVEKINEWVKKIGDPDQNMKKSLNLQGANERLVSLFSDFWRPAALSKWPPIDLKFCMGTIEDQFFSIPLERRQFSTPFLYVAQAK